MKKKNKVLWITLGSLLAINVVIFGSFFIYTGNYYHATQTALDYSKSDNEINYLEKDGNYIFVPKKEANKGLILYPGALVEDNAYAPLANKLAHQGIYTVICHMNFHLAFFSKSAATAPIQENPNISFYIGGHSLGGTMASIYASEHFSSLKGLIFLASYSAEDLSKTSLKCLSLYGTKDGVLKLNEYEGAKSNLPNLEEHIIEGGNHAQFGSYGFQKGDNEASISPEEQWDISANYIADFILR